MCSCLVAYGDARHKGNEDALKRQDSLEHWKGRRWRRSGKGKIGSFQGQHRFEVCRHFLEIQPQAGVGMVG
ncbi:unnamed protein product [Arctogadus glacialis]